jgi:hypothetical protein
MCPACHCCAFPTWIKDGLVDAIYKLAKGKPASFDLGITFIFISVLDNCIRIDTIGEVACPIPVNIVARGKYGLDNM